jgi:amino acid transporter
LIEGLNHGIGSIFAYFGGRHSDKFGSKRISIVGNSIFTLLPFTGFPVIYIGTGLLFSDGWWTRNFRSPSRRAMLVEPNDLENSSNAFGLLHGIDTAGGLIASLILILLVYFGYEFMIIFLS